jgi:hypothetical protein
LRTKPYNWSNVAAQQYARTQFLLIWQPQHPGNPLTWSLRC